MVCELYRNKIYFEREQSFGLSLRSVLLFLSCNGSWSSSRARTTFLSLQFTFGLGHPQKVRFLPVPKISWFYMCPSVVPGSLVSSEHGKHPCLHLDAAACPTQLSRAVLKDWKSVFPSELSEWTMEHHKHLSYYLPAENNSCHHYWMLSFQIKSDKKEKKYFDSWNQLADSAIETKTWSLHKDFCWLKSKGERIEFQTQVPAY